MVSLTEGFDENEDIDRRGMTVSFLELRTTSLIGGFDEKEGIERRGIIGSYLELRTTSLTEGFNDVKDGIFVSFLEL
jgi:hypothetical protein